MYDLTQSYESWSEVPLDDLGYYSAHDIMILSHVQRMDLLRMAMENRWNLCGWRNRDNSLVEFMQPERWAGKHVMDFGCGFGLDGIRFGAAGAQVTLADINPRNLNLAQQNAGALGVFADAKIVSTLWPFFVLDKPVDLFWSMGVLHHFPYASAVLKQAVDSLSPTGECRILLYSDRRWVDMMGEPPPENTETHPRFAEYVRKCDSVGHYADWYDEPKVNALVAGFGRVESVCYLCDNQMIGAVIKAEPANSSTQAVGERA